MRCAGAVCIAILIFTASSAAAIADGLQAGQWQVTQQAVINGAAGPPTQRLRCLKPEDVADLEKTFSPQSQTVNSTCERTEFQSTAQKLKWHLQCRGQLDMEVDGDFTFTDPTHYTATVTTEASMAGNKMQSSRVNISAERVGDCQ